MRIDMIEQMQENAGRNESILETAPDKEMTATDIVERSKSIE
jgi:hypothetical protein